MRSDTLSQLCFSSVRPRAPCVPPWRVIVPAMETKAFVQQVLRRVERTDARRSWDAVWRALLACVVRGDALPDGTAHDVIAAVKASLGERPNVPRSLAEFHTANRSPGPVFSEVWCRVEGDRGDISWLHATTRGQQVHAECQILERLSRWETPPTLITFYLNLSPCSDCAEAILRFVEDRRSVSVRLRFSALFAHHGDNHRRGLRRLASRGVALAVFDDSDWTTLARVAAKEQLKTRDSQPRKLRRSDTDASEPAAKKRRRST